MVNKQTEQDKSSEDLLLEFQTEQRNSKSLLIGLGLVVVLVLAGIVAVYLLRAEREQEAGDRAKGFYTADQIQSLLTKIDEGNEFAFLHFMNQDNSTAAVGEGDTTPVQPRDVLDVYREILDYAPENLKVKDGLEKIFYLTVHRAEKETRKGKYKDALTFYKKAKQIKPGSREVAEGMNLTKNRIKISSTSFTKPGTRTNASVYQLVQSKMSYIKYLYEKEKRVTPDLKGKVNIEFSVVADGSVSKARVISTTVNNPALERKLLTAVHRWNFGKVRDDSETLTLSYPFVFY